MRPEGKIASPVSLTLFTPRTSMRMPNSMSVAMSVQWSLSTTTLMFCKIGLVSRAATAALAN